MELTFLQIKKILAKLKKRTTFALMCIVMKTSWFFQYTFQIKKFENLMDLLLIINENKSHYVYIKDCMFHKTKNKNKKYFLKSCLQCFSSKNVLTEHKEVCLNINGAQSVRLEKGTVEFKNYFKQLPVPF